jgi:potassium efflux system protein
MKFMLRLCVLLLAVSLGLPVFGQPARAPAPSEAGLENVPATIDRIRNGLSTVETALTQHGLTDTTLQSLRQQITPLSEEIDGLINRLTPHLSAVKTRLDQLGAKPDDKAPPENPAITAERADEQKAYNETDELLKRTKLLGVQADQLTTSVATRQRNVFTSSLFQRSTSILSPALWVSVVRETPSHIEVMNYVLGGWVRDINAQLSGWRLPVFWTIAALIVLAYWPLSRLARRVVPREKSERNPGRFRKVLAAWWVAAIVALLPMAILLAFALLFDAFGLSTNRVEPIAKALTMGVIRVSLALGLAFGLLAPSHARWRLVGLGDAPAERLVRMVLLVTIIVSLTRVLEAINDMIAASLTFSVATRGLGTLLVAITMALSLRGLVDTDEGGGANQNSASVADVSARGWEASLRLSAWVAVVVIAGAILIGFVALGSFVVDQVVWVAGVGAVLYLGSVLLEQGINYALRPETRSGHILITSVGLRRESIAQVAVLLTGVTRVVLVIVASLLVLAPWGVQSDDWLATLRSVFFGFQVGDVTVSLVQIAIAFLLFAIGTGATRAVQHWLDTRYLPLTRLDNGLRNSIRTSLGYIGVVLTTGVSLAYLGLDFQKLAIVAGALSVGIGFGLQSIVNNFVSGLILLWERAVRVGDWIVVGTDQGYVRRINVRSTEIETFDRAAVIIPNSNLITGIVKNFVRTDRVGRVMVEVEVNGTADPEAVRTALLELAKAQDGVLSLPAPQVRFTALSGASLKFELYCFIDDVEMSQRVRSDMHFAIFKRFKEAKFFDGPAPVPTAIDLVGLDRLETLLKTHAAPLSIEIAGLDRLEALMRQSRGEAAQ